MGSGGNGNHPVMSYVCCFALFQSQQRVQTGQMFALCWLPDIFRHRVCRQLQSRSCRLLTKVCQELAADDVTDIGIIAPGALLPFLTHSGFGPDRLGSRAMILTRPEAYFDPCDPERAAVGSDGSELAYSAP